MIDHIYISVTDLEPSFDLYLASLAPLGWTEFGRFSSTGPGGEPDLFGMGDGTSSIWLRKGKGAISPLYLGIKADSTELVDATYAAAIAAGAPDDGAPGPRPQFAEGYYAANFTDFDGNQLEIVNKAW